MPRTTKKAVSKTQQHPHARAQQLAKETADRYFTAIAAEIPFDDAPGKVDLIGACIDIEAELPGSGERDGEEDRWKTAGYLLGIEMGRRMAGGAR